jgi:predicted transcriptional regulator
MHGLPQVRDYMDRFINSLRPEMDILEAVDFLLERRVTGAPVLGEQGQLLGLLSEEHCLRLLAHGHDGERVRGTVSDFMTQTVKTVAPDTDIYYAAGLLMTGEQRRLMVVLNGKVVGTITRFDLLRAIKAHHR